MKFSKTDNIYKISKMTGNKDSFLGIRFSENSEETTEVIEVSIKYPKNINKNVSKDKILEKVNFGLSVVNKFLKTDYKLSHIYYVASLESVYEDLIQRLIRHYHDGKEFIEVKIV